jgi:putative endonuclease
MTGIQQASSSTREKGQAAEDMAADHLLAHGYTILSRNYQSRRGEIDCVARDPSGTIAFIEVKSARHGSSLHPFFRVTRAKQMKLVSMARQYRSEHSLTDTPCRFDVIAVQAGRVEHLKNAFLAG